MNLENGYLTNVRITEDSTVNDDIQSETSNATDELSYNGRSNINESSTNSDKTTYEEGHTDSNIIKGKRGNKTYSQMLTEYRATFLNIDLEIIKAIESLFFGLWE